MQRAKIQDMIGCLGVIPAVIWQGLVQMKTCWVARHRGKGADLHKARLHCVSLAGVCLEGSNLSHATLIRVDLYGTNLASADLSHTHLFDSNLQSANLRGANLQWAGLFGTDLRNADLTSADLTKARFQNPDRCVPAEFRRLVYHAPPNLAGADLTGAILIGADLIDADLTGIDLTGVVCDVRTRWPEGFDPEQHGVEIPPMATEWRLVRDEVVLGTLQGCRPDYQPHLPQFRCRFTPTAAFAEVRPLFDEDMRLLHADRIEDCMKVHQEINALGLRLDSPEAQDIAPWFVRIDGGELLFRY
jgi:hypothetical protein